ncbi:hypothetical protein OTU49_012664, partial [Cherax quadricarinatus]
EGVVVASRPPLVRSRTLPAIVVPGITVLQTTLDTAERRDSGGVERTSPGRLSFGDGEVLGLTPSGGSPGSLKVPGALAASSGGLGRIARLLVKDATRSGEDAYRRRTHSLESKNGAAPLRRAASIDSIVDTNAINTASNNGINSKSSVLSMTKSNGHLRAYLPVSPALYKRSSFKFDRVA